MTFQIFVAVIARWKNGKMVEESLFWDNDNLKKQLDIAIELRPNLPVPESTAK